MAQLNGLVLLKPTSVDKAGTGSTATINTNGSVTFSSCTSLSLNGVFSAEYCNYMVVARRNNTGSDALNMQLRASGVNNSTASSYVYQELFANSTSLTGSRTTFNIARVGTVESTLRYGDIYYFFGPYLAQPTAFRSCTAEGASNARLSDWAFTHNQLVAYDGFTLFSGGGTATFSGLIAVYGMRD